MAEHENDTALALEEFGGFVPEFTFHGGIHPAPPKLTPGEIRDGLTRLENELMDHEQLPIPTKHYFANGVYVREVLMKKGMFVIGQVHTLEHVVIVSQGDAYVLTDSGSERITAPCTFISSPGVKRALLILEDMIFTTIHPNPENMMDLDQIEEHFAAPTYAEWEMRPESKVQVLINTVKESVQLGDNPNPRLWKHRLSEIGG